MKSEDFFIYSNPIFWICYISVRLVMLPRDLHKWLEVSNWYFYFFEFEDYKSKKDGLAKIIKDNPTYQKSKNPMTRFFWQKMTEKCQKELCVTDQ